MIHDIYPLVERVRGRLVLAPTVVAVGKSRFLGHPRYKIPEDGDDAVRLCSFAGKGCYDSFGTDGRTNSANQRTIIAQRHGSVLEHYSISMFIEGVSRGLSLELNRHRPLAISQRSTRYTAEGEAKLVLNPVLAGIARGVVRQLLGRVPVAGDVDPSDAALDLLYHALQSGLRSISDYEVAVEKYMGLAPADLQDVPRRKWARGQARDVTPHMLETRATYTGNLRCWRWVLEMRSAGDAEGEIRRMADALIAELRVHAPLYFEDFAQVGVKDGIPIWRAQNSKV